ncbi:toll/interleukin-1 receptor domain-containing protein, partial [Anaerohalosphaeraceae bacterium U12dextr]
MPDVFISYSTKDQKFADYLHALLTKEGLDVYQAGLSLQPGQQWTEKIIENLKQSQFVLFLASQAACQSSFVQQEVGHAIVEKKLIPVVWDIRPEQLPGWAKNFQAINLASATIERIQEQFIAFARKIKVDKKKGLIVAGCLVAAAMALLV